MEEISCSDKYVRIASLKLLYNSKCHDLSPKLSIYTGRIISSMAELDVVHCFIAHLVLMQKFARNALL